MLPPGVDAQPLRLAVRCDGDSATGAGHVARCLPLADALSARGWEVGFVGRFGGLAGWLARTAQYVAEEPGPGPCGLDPTCWTAAIVDSYELSEAELCELARRLPIATLGEARRCLTDGVLVDYHLDQAGRTLGPRLLAGPRYAPLDPAFAGAGRAGAEVDGVLVAVGGSERGRRHLEALRESVSRAFPAAEVIVPQADPPGAYVRLIDLVPSVDLAVVAAGFTAYELACAGIPQVAVAIAANQRRVIQAMHQVGLGRCVDLDAGEDLARVDDALDELKDPVIRRQQSELGRSLFDGQGAARAADGLLERWALGT